jgi:hypothetical protein
MSLPLWTAALLVFFVSQSIVGAIIVTGAIGGNNVTTGARAFRREINDFVQSGPAWDLYVLSLQSMQNSSQSNPLSYYQIAGRDSQDPCTRV